MELVGPFGAISTVARSSSSRSEATPCGDTAPLGASVLRGNTALHYAAYYGHGYMVELLLKHKADLEAKDIYGSGSLEWRKAFGNPAG